MILLILGLGCSSSEQSSSISTQAQQPTAQQPLSSNENFKNRDQGQKHPPLPANNPIWEWDAQSFVPDYGWFGEHSWMDVRMRVAGHMSAAARDLARSAALSGNYKLAAERYKNAHQMLSDIPSPSDGFSAQINTLLKEALKRDERWMLLIDSSASSVPPLDNSSKETLSQMRDRYFKLAMLYDRTPNSAELKNNIKKFQEDLLPFLELREDLKIDQFSDFIDRHHLRVRLYQAYLESLDPIAPTERWGYWKPVEMVRQALLLGWAAEMMGGANWSQRINDHAQKSISGPENMPKSAVLWPSTLGSLLKSPDQSISFNPEELGALPTGDSLIDVAAHPGPKAIGTLERLGLSDQDHYNWLKQVGVELSDSLSKEPQKSLKICQEAIKKLDSYSHGSRFYNVKQLRNSCIRQFARSKQFLLANTLLQDHFPLHHQDWACPNRAGILHAISGRILLLEQAEHGTTTDAEKMLEQALSEGHSFLQQVTLAEQGKINGPRPPAMGHGGQKGHTGQSPHKTPPALKQQRGNPSPSQR